MRTSTRAALNNLVDTIRELSEQRNFFSKVANDALKRVGELERELKQTRESFAKATAQ